ncbi:hypothetical protein D1646_03595 [Pseudoflavonifractor sp. 60]|uniref:LCP family protein n=1 Tax=Pseudoflavonifractor sp. 60 TaxID=2304576 RepID=UPI00136FDBE6|nr:LCP family protein [Pseudoflavonifractor sp. 60]NBI65908.1 hypothetical protein [Pseudoflavonifractor sp. 60]
MSETNKHRGKREAPSPLVRWWRGYRNWVAGLSRGQRIRYRVCLGLGITAAVILVIALCLRSWIRLPEVPTVPPGPVANGSQITPGDLSANLPGGNGLEYAGAELPQVTRSGQKPGYYTFLLAGRDVVSGATDTMILITYDTKGKTINAISLLRDTMVNTSAKAGAQKRLNVVFARNMGGRSLSEKERVENGMTALKQEVSKLTGIYPNFYVLVEWEAIGELVDAIGGVEFEVPFDMDYDDPYQDLHIHQKAGLRLLSGRDAMEVIRFRKNNNGTHILGDSGRTQIQRDFLTAVIKECLQPDILLKLPALAQIFVDNVSTDLSIGNILAFAELAVGMDIENGVKFVAMPFDNTSYKGAALALARQDELLEVLNDGINPYQDEIQASDLQLMYRKRGGGYNVTNATLADPTVGQVPVAKPKEEEPAPEEQEPPEGENPGGEIQPGGDVGDTSRPDENGAPGDTTQPGESGESGDTSQPGESGESGDISQPGEDAKPGNISAIDPSEIFPDPTSDAAPVIVEPENAGESSAAA